MDGDLYCNTPTRFQNAYNTDGITIVREKSHVSNPSPLQSMLGPRAFIGKYKLVLDSTDRLCGKMSLLDVAVPAFGEASDFRQDLRSRRLIAGCADCSR